MGVYGGAYSGPEIDEKLSSMGWITPPYISGTHYFPDTDDAYHTTAVSQANNLGLLIYVNEEITIDALSMFVIAIDDVHEFVICIAPIDPYTSKTTGIEIAQTAPFIPSNTGFLTASITPSVLTKGFYVLSIQITTDDSPTLTISSGNSAPISLAGYTVGGLDFQPDSGIVVHGYTFRVTNGGNTSNITLTKATGVKAPLIGIKVQ